MRFAELIWKNLFERGARSLLTVLGLAIAVAAITTLWHTAWGYARSANGYYAAHGVDIVVVRAGVSNRLTSRLSADLSQQVSSVPGVAHVEGVLTEMVSLGDAKLIGIPLRGYSLANPALERFQIAEGRKLAVSDRNAVLVGNALAETLGRHASSKIDVEGRPFEIVGIYLAENPFDANCLVAPLAVVQALMERPGAVSEFQVSAAPNVNADAQLNDLCRAIEALKDDKQTPLGLKAQPTHQFVATASEARMGGAMAWGTTALVVGLSTLAILNTMLMSVFERTKEIGILRAIGWRRARVVRLILGESLVLSAGGAALGALLAAFLVRFLAHWPRTSLIVSSGPSLTAFALGLAVAICTGFVGALYPALHAASVPPVESLRHE